MKRIRKNKARRLEREKRRAERLFESSGAAGGQTLRLEAPRPRNRVAAALAGNARFRTRVIKSKKKDLPRFDWRRELDEGFDAGAGRRARTTKTRGGAAPAFFLRPKQAFEKHV